MAPVSASISIALPETIEGASGHILELLLLLLLLEAAAVAV